MSKDGGSEGRVKEALDDGWRDSSVCIGSWSWVSNRERQNVPAECANDELIFSITSDCKDRCGISAGVCGRRRRRERGSEVKHDGGRAGWEVYMDDSTRTHKQKEGRRRGEERRNTRGRRIWKRDGNGAGVGGDVSEGERERREGSGVIGERHLDHPQHRLRVKYGIAITGKWYSIE